MQSRVWSTAEWKLEGWPRTTCWRVTVTWARLPVRGTNCMPWSRPGPITIIRKCFMKLSRQFGYFKLNLKIYKLFYYWIMMFDANKCTVRLIWSTCTSHITSQVQKTFTSSCIWEMNIISVRWLHINCLPIYITQLTTIVNLIITLVSSSIPPPPIKNEKKKEKTIK